MLEGCPHRNPVPVTESDLGEQRRSRQPGGEQGDIVGHLSVVVADQLSLAEVPHHAPGANGDTARCEGSHDPLACALGQARTDDGPGLHQPDLYDV